MAFGELIEDLATQTDKITPEEFLSAAQNGISSDLIEFAREREVPEKIIQYGRERIIELMADALRFGVSWNDLIVFVSALAGYVPAECTGASGRRTRQRVYAPFSGHVVRAHDPGGIRKRRRKRSTFLLENCVSSRRPAVHVGRFRA